MKFKVSSADLLSHLQAISRVISSKNSLQILDNVLLKLEGNTLTMTASDIETTLITSINVDEVEGSGMVAVANKLLIEALGKFPDLPLNFDIDNSTLGITITTDFGGVYKLVGQNGDMYPELPKLEEDVNELVISSEVLLNGISKTIFCTADDGLRPVMNGIFFDVTPDSLVMVATDAHKLVRYKVKQISSSASEENNFSFIFPKKPALMLRSILQKETEEVKITLDAKNAYFQLNQYQMVCRQVEGRYPNYNGVIPNDNPIKTILDRASFVGALKRVSVFSNQANNLIKLDFRDNAVSISAQDIDFSTSGIETVSCQYENESMQIGFKSTFLIEMLNCINSTEVVLELADASRAGIILPLEQPEDEEILMLLMPMLLND